MRILMLSTDFNILGENTEARKRMEDYAGIFSELHLVVLVGQNEAKKDGKSGNLFLHPVLDGFNLLKFWRLYRVSNLVCRNYKLDVISAQGPDEVGLIGFLISKKFRIPFQLQIHTDVFSSFYRRASWKERARYHIAKFLIPRADCVRVVSERIKRSLVANCQLPVAKISILPIFTDISKFFNAVPGQEAENSLQNYSFKMVAVGRFVDKEKNFSMLIEVMREFVKFCPGAVLVLVGDGPDKENYKLQIKNYKLENSVILKKWSNNLPSLYKSFDLYLMSSNYEGWGRTVIEAMTAGLPIVMTDVGLAGEVVKNNENGVVVSVGDKSDFFAAIADLYRNPEKREKFAVAAAQSVQRLNFRTKEEYLLSYKKSFEICL